jgi:hypothetical protein
MRPGSQAGRKSRPRSPLDVAKLDFDRLILAARVRQRKLGHDGSRSVGSVAIAPGRWSAKC